MCGLFGVTSAILSTDEINNAAFLGYLSGTRGMDSSGIAVVGSNSNNKIQYTVLTSLLSSPEFVLSNGHDKTVAKISNPFIYMGHARWATKGSVTLENAHPIEYRNVIMCHNGTIHSLGDQKKDVSDSRELIEIIQEKGLEKALDAAKYGAYAISLIDFGRRELSFVRNSDRPLWFMSTKTGGTIYWASERWMLIALAEKEGSHKYASPQLLETDLIRRLPFKSVKFKDSKVTIKKSIADSSVLFFKNLAIREDEPYDPNQDFSVKSPTVKELFEGTEQQKSVSVPLLPAPTPVSAPGPIQLYQGWEEKTYRPVEMEKHLRKGCFNCQSTLNLKKPIFWFSPANPICEDCYNNDPLIADAFKGHADKRIYEGKLINCN